MAALEALVQVGFSEKLQQVNPCHILVTCCISVLVGICWLAAPYCFCSRAEGL